MVFIITLTSIIQALATSLGVGSSTLAIVNFFVAIADGKIEPDERRMMGVVYIVLRIAMLLILATTLALFMHTYVAYGVPAITTFHIAQLLVLAVLFINALLMTIHLMPNTFGPALQAGSWYTLGVLAALSGLDLVDFTLLQFSLGYLTALISAIGLVNGVMALQVARRRKQVQ